VRACCSGFRVPGSGFSFGVRGSGFWVRVRGSGVRSSGFRGSVFGVQRFGFRGSGDRSSRFRGSVFAVQGIGLRGSGDRPHRVSVRLRASAYALAGSPFGVRTTESLRTQNPRAPNKEPTNANPEPRTPNPEREPGTWNPEPRTARSHYHLLPTPTNTPLLSTSIDSITCCTSTPIDSLCGGAS
jgi:hypothetical protein